MNRTRKLAVAALFVVALALGAAYGLLVIDKPRIESVDNEWGTVTADRSEVVTTIDVDNPFLLRVGDAAADVEYTVGLNGIQFAAERRESVRLDGRTDSIRTSTWLNNDEIPAWWVTHVNDDETTTVRIDPSIVLDYGGVKAAADPWTRERTFHTDLLEPLATNQSHRFSAFDRTILHVNGTNAHWGHATAERTPILASAKVRNALAVPLPITDLEYTARMNGIVVGQGQAAQQTVIPAESTTTLEANASIDNSRLDEWWVTHLQNDETSTLSVSFNATVEFAGTERRIPLEFISYDRTFSTDVFGGDANDNQTATAAGTRSGPSAAGERRLPRVATTRRRAA